MTNSRSALWVCLLFAALVGAAKSGLAAEPAHAYSDFVLDGSVSEPPLVAGDQLWVPTATPRLHVFSLASRKLLWSRHDSKYSTFTIPALADDLAIIGASRGYPSMGRILAFDQRTGKTKWKSAKVDFVADRPTVQDGKVYVGSHDGKVHVLDLSTGKEQWSFATGGPIYKAPLVADDLVIFGSGDKHVRAIYADSGKLAWSCLTKGEVASRPAFSGQLAFVGSLDRRLYAIDVQEGTIRWTYESDGYVTNPIAYEDTVYVGTMAGEVLALDKETGKLRWRFVERCERCNDMNGFADVALSEEFVVSASRTGALIALRRRDGGVQWRLDGRRGFWPQASVSGQVVYVSWANKLLQLNLASGTPVSAPLSGSKASGHITTARSRPATRF